MLTASHIASSPVARTLVTATERSMRPIAGRGGVRGGAVIGGGKLSGYRDFCNWPNSPSDFSRLKLD